MHIQTSTEREQGRAARIHDAVARDRVVLLAAALGAVWLVFFAAATLITDAEALSGKLIGDVVYLVPVAVAAGLSAVAVRRTSGQQRNFWVLIAASNGCWLTGEVLWGFLELVLEVEPFPSVADVFFIAGMSLVPLAIVVGFGRPRQLRLWRAVLDASIIVAATGYAGWTLLIAPALGFGPSLATFVGATYPLLSVATLIVLASFAFSGHRQVPRSMALVSMAIAAGALTNAAYTYLTVLHEYASGSIINVGWQLEAVLLVLAALVAIRHDEVDARARFFARDLGLPLTLVGLAGCFAIVTAHAVHDDVHTGTFVLLGYAIVAVVARLLLTSSEKDRIAVELEEALAEQERLAVTDGLTGLHNRRFFEEVLKLEVGRTRRNGDATGLLVIDVDHFKRINDRHGHVAGDLVLAEIAQRLHAAVRSIDVVARYGGEEFVVVLPAVHPDTLPEIAERCRRGIADRPFTVTGAPLSVTVSIGAACLPLHAETAEQLVGVADKALYAAKDAGRNVVHIGDQGSTPGPDAHSDGTSVMEYLHRLADEIDARQSSDAHSRAMCALAASVADALGLDGDAQWRVVTAARFHDIGKVRTADAILQKPGPLTDTEWAVIREHPEDGARLLALAPDLEDVAPIVRAHHERWDGSGYPGGLAGSAIPIEARIIAVCDAWTAMLADRPYRPALAVETARSEIERCSGGHFDPTVVAAFFDVVSTVGEARVDDTRGTRFFGTRDRYDP